ncbi:MAG: hypothetical protein DWQ09_03410 [Proteobacteria bacterium]|nr:MAG: hypothetical protein DWQ09_03410 [Pseudomonadota bacterium]QKK11057.1 MAG: hypothetical protein HND59_05045 [Pseudomonadota bacterium]
MNANGMFMIWPNQPGLSAIVWALVAIVLLYMARNPVHQAMMGLGKVIHNALRVASRSVSLARERLELRNREVLLAAGRESAERLIEREFRRIEATTQRDLAGYPAMHRKVMEQVTAIDEDYRGTAEIAPEIPGWVDAIEAVAKIQSVSEPRVAEVLEDIHRSFEKSHGQAISAYRQSGKERHRLLARMMPYWRRLAQTLDSTEKSINRLLERTQHVDKQLAEYEEMTQGTDRALRTLASSSFTQFVISAFVLLVAIGGAVINFNLIAYPMQEMVGGASYIGAFRTADVAAMVIILVEVAMGLFLMESLRVTRLFPVIGALDDRLRVRMIWITFAILFTLASVESALAYMRDLIAADVEALRQSLAGGAAMVAADNRWIPTVGQMVMGFVLPFALIFVAIPLESFVHASRTVLGMVAVGVLRLIAAALRLIGNLAWQGARMLVRIYDLVIFAPLWLEDVIRKSGTRTAEPARSGLHQTIHKALTDSGVFTESAARAREVSP